MFWNIHNNRPVENIVRLVQEHAVDILILAESPFGQQGQDVQEALNAAPPLPGEQPFYYLHSDGGGIVSPPLQVFSRMPDVLWTCRIVHARYAIWEARSSGKRSFLLATAHFPEIPYQQGDEQRECAIALRLDLEKAEEGWDDPCSIVIGDLNANPFDAGIISVYGLNATPSRRFAEQAFRKYNGRTYRYLYNPMWRFLAHETRGTYYKSNISAPIRYDWHLLDQVLMRPAVLRHFDKGEEPDLIIPTSDGLSSLLTETGLPKEGLSDHLPLLFRFYLTGD